MPPPREEAARVPFFSGVSFADLTERAVDMADRVGPPHDVLLRLLQDCEEEFEGPLFKQQRKGATYKTLAAIAHASGMTMAGRQAWYRVAEDVPLSQRHAGHVLGKLKERR